MFKEFPPAMAGERYDGAARVGIFGGAMQVVDGVLSGGQMGGVWRRNGLAMAFSLRRAENPFVAQRAEERQASGSKESLFYRASVAHKECRKGGPCRTLPPMSS
jgi:hypothetical protein